MTDLRELEAKATPGPWWVSHHPDNTEHFIEPEIASVEEDRGTDATLIVESRNALPDLLAVVEAALEGEANDWDHEDVVRLKKSLRPFLATEGGEDG